MNVFLSKNSSAETRNTGKVGESVHYRRKPTFLGGAQRVSPEKEGQGRTMGKKRKEFGLSGRRKVSAGGGKENCARMTPFRGRTNEYSLDHRKGPGRDERDRKAIA